MSTNTTGLMRRDRRGVSARGAHLAGLARLMTQPLETIALDGRRDTRVPKMARRMGEVPERRAREAGPCAC